MKLNKTNTQRGFALISFKDRYSIECSIQESSMASESAIWFGVDDPNPQVMASTASQYGIKTEATTGWVPYPIPDAVSINTRMHLTQDQVKALLPILQKFADTGEL